MNLKELEEKYPDELREIRALMKKSGCTTVDKTLQEMISQELKFYGDVKVTDSLEKIVLGSIRDIFSPEILTPQKVKKLVEPEDAETESLEESENEDESPTLIQNAIDIVSPNPQPKMPKPTSHVDYGAFLNRDIFEEISLRNVDDPLPLHILHVEADHNTQFDTPAIRVYARNLISNSFVSFVTSSRIVRAQLSEIIPFVLFAKKTSKAGHVYYTVKQVRDFTHDEQVQKLGLSVKDAPTDSKQQVRLDGE